MKTVGKLLNHFLLLHLNTKTKAKKVKPDTKTNANLRNIENFENKPIRAKLCQTRSVYENSIRNTDPQCITINKCYHGKFRVQESRLINLVSLTRGKKRKRKKRKIWDAIGTRLERIATTPGPSSSLSFGRPSHMQCNNSAAWSQMKPCRHAAPCEVISPTSATQGGATGWAAYIMRPMDISASHLPLPSCLDSNDWQPNLV
jgi:hypothetical protein